MNADAFRHLYNYHFAENRKIWETYIVPLSEEQFTRELSYSRGSIRSQLLHIMGADEGWFSGLRGVEPPPDPIGPTTDRTTIRAYWDNVEKDMRAYLANLRDDMLFTKPFPAGEDENLILWQVLLHVANHGTDHRAQVLRQLNDLGVETKYQDYIFYVYAHP